MKNNRLTIRINKPVAEVFNFTLDPTMTPKWIYFVGNEKTSDWPVKLGTIYENESKSGRKAIFIVTDLQKNLSFELRSEKGDYFVRYTFTPIGDTVTNFEYHEWVTEGDLEEPFTQDILEKLKKVMEVSA